MKTKIILGMSILIAVMHFSCESEKKEVKVAEKPDYFLNSSEYKLLLNPDMFADYEQGFEQYWEIIKQVAEEEGIEVLETENPLKLGHKEISFFDTKDLELRKNSFLLRQKVKYKSGHKKPGFEFGLKFRQPNPEKTLSLDLSMSEGYTPKFDRIELESDVVYYSIKNGERDVTYAVSNSIQLENQPEMTLGEFTKIYPVLGDLGIKADATLHLVADMAADEWMVKPGHLDFGSGLSGRMDMTIWILQTDAGEVRIPEFSFDHDFVLDKPWDVAAMQKCTDFIDKLNDFNPDWVVPGELKAAYLFR